MYELKRHFLFVDTRTPFATSYVMAYLSTLWLLLKSFARNRRTLTCISAAVRLLILALTLHQAELTPPAVGVTEQQIVVGANVHVSKPLANRPHGEVHLAANPRNAKN